VTIRQIRVLRVQSNIQKDSGSSRYLATSCCINHLFTVINTLDQIGIFQRLDSYKINLPVKQSSQTVFEIKKVISIIQDIHFCKLNQEIQVAFCSKTLCTGRAKKVELFDFVLQTQFTKFGYFCIYYPVYHYYFLRPSLGLCAMVFIFIRNSKSFFIYSLSI